MKTTFLAILTLAMATLSAIHLHAYERDRQVGFLLGRAQCALDRGRAQRSNAVRARLDYQEAVALTQLALETAGESPALHQLLAAYQAEREALSIPPTQPPPAWIVPSIEKASITYGVDEKLIAAIIQQESNYNVYAESLCGAQGLMQMMPETCQQYAIQDPFDPEQNLLGGTHYLRDLLDRFHGDVRLAVAAFNAGPLSVEKYGGRPPYPETQNYVRNVMRNYRG